MRAAQKIYENSIFPKLAPHQRVILVPGVFGNTPEGCAAHNLSCPLDEQEAQIVLKLEAYFEWAKAEPRIAGFNPWHFDYRGSDQAAPSNDMKLGAVRSTALSV